MKVKTFKNMKKEEKILHRVQTRRLNTKEAFGGTKLHALKGIRKYGFGHS